MNTKTIGERTEAKVLAALLQVYPTVLVPFGENQRYDFVFEDLKGEFQRVQCKTGKITNGAIVFWLNSVITIKGQNIHRPYQGEIDFFGVSCSGLPDVYLVPIDLVGVGSCSLRIDPPKRTNNNVNWAKDYLIYSPCG